MLTLLCAHCGQGFVGRVPNATPEVNATFAFPREDTDVIASVTLGKEVNASRLILDRLDFLAHDDPFLIVMGECYHFGTRMSSVNRREGVSLPLKGDFAPDALEVQHEFVVH